MAFLGLFKKKENYFDKNIEPKCAYCANGKPAKSEGKVLCGKCGIVGSDYSCKKFVYSPLMRVPEEKTAEQVYTASQKEASTDTETKTEPETVKEEKSAPIREEKDAQKAYEPSPASIPEPELKTESAPKPIQEAEKAEEKPSLSEIKIPFENVHREPDAKPAQVGGISNAVSDNSEKIKKLSEISIPATGGIAFEVKPKEIVLPQVNEAMVNGISNNVEKRDTDEILSKVAATKIEDIKKTDE